MSKLTPFDFLNSINSGPKTEDLFKETREASGEGANANLPTKAYIPFMINRGLSYFQDTILFANEMNQRAHISSIMQYDFLRNAIRPRKRFSKWFKAEQSDDIDLIKRAYGYSNEKARGVISLFNPEKLASLRSEFNVGGKA